MNWIGGEYDIVERDKHTSCLLVAESSGMAWVCLAGSRRPDWRDVEAREERMACESLVTGGVMRDMVD
jgi:hypothetical protein